MRNKTLLCLGAGAALPLSFAPFGWFWLAPVSYAALLLAWRRASPLQAFGLGFSFGGASFLAGTYWIYISVHGYGGAPVPLAVVVMLGLVAIMALYSGLVGYVAGRWFGTDGAGAWLAAIPALWVLAEWWRGWFLSGFGWLAAGYTQTDTWLLGLAPVFGLHGVSWAVLVLAGVGAALVGGDRRARIAAVVALAAVLVAAFALEQRAWTEPKDRLVSAALIQGAVPQDRKWLPEQLPATLDLYRDLTRDALGSRLIVWPEAAIPAYYETMSAFLDAVAREATVAGSTIMLGSLRWDTVTAAAENAVFVLGEPGAVYVKRHLVPYGEFFPVPGFVRTWLASMGLALGDLRAGDADQPPLAVADERIAVTICYEDVFGSEQLASLPAASLLVNVSNDGWFGESIALPQHLQIARMRAAEAGRFLLRATNTGVTAVIGPRGELVETLPPFQSGILRTEVRGHTGATPYAVWGNYAVVVLALIVAVAQLLTTKLTMRPGT